MSQYTEVRKRLAEQGRQASKQRSKPPEDFKAAMERIRAELKAKEKGNGA